jgi:PAS domain S-box-containing protein
MNWWVGDAVAIGSIVPFSLIYVLPGLRVFLGYRELDGKAEEATQRTGRHELRGLGRVLEKGLFARSIVAVLWAALSERFSSGSEMFYLLFPPLILSLAGQVLGALISERDESEQKLSQEEARRRLLLESTGEAVYGVDNKGECTFCNQALLRLLGYGSQEELLGRNIHDVIHHTSREGTANSREECSMQRELQGGKKFHVAEELLWRSNGTSFDAELWRHPLFEDGERRGAVVTFVDITERKKAQQALRQAKEEAEAAN